MKPSCDVLLPEKFICHFNFFQNKNDCYLSVYCQKIFGRLNFGAQLCASSLCSLIKKGRGKWPGDALAT
jgi:hypothetical protein